MDECKAILERIAVAVEKMASDTVTIKEGQVFVIAELAQIRNLLGGS